MFSKTTSAFILFFLCTIGAVATETTKITQQQAENIVLEKEGQAINGPTAVLEEDGWHVISFYKSAKAPNLYIIDANSGKINFRLDTGVDWKIYKDPNKTFTFLYPVDWEIVKAPFSHDILPDSPPGLFLIIQPKIMQNVSESNSCYGGKCFSLKTAYKHLSLKLLNSLQAKSSPAPFSSEIIDGKLQTRYDGYSPGHGGEINTHDYLIPIEGTNYTFTYKFEYADTKLKYPAKFKSDIVNDVIVNDNETIENIIKTFKSTNNN